MPTETESKAVPESRDVSGRVSSIFAEVGSCSTRFRIAVFLSSSVFNTLIAAYLFLSKGPGETHQTWSYFVIPTFWGVLFSRFILYRMPKIMAYHALIALTVPWSLYALATLVGLVTSFRMPDDVLQGACIVSLVLLAGLGNASMNSSSWSSETYDSPRSKRSGGVP